MINPLFLRTFVCLVKTKHFTRTADALNMTQPGVTQHIKKLELQLGTALLNRYGKKFELTNAGESLFHYANQLSEAEDELMQKIVGDKGHVGECKLACSGSMAMLLYPQLLALQKSYKGLCMSVEAAPNTKIIEMICANQVDLGIVTQPINNPELLQQRLGEDALCLVVPAKAVSSWDSLMQLGFINHPDGHHYAIQLLEMNFANDFLTIDRIPQSGYVNQLSQILLPVSQGLGFTVIPKSSLDAFPYPELIRSAELKTKVNETAYLISKKHRALAKRYRLIKELLSKQWQ
jgi:DNA-binding transcriptional LysR family regulator